LEKRREIGRQLFETHKELTPARREAAACFLAGEQAFAEWHWSGNSESRSYSNFWYGFDGRPKTCFDAFGDYRMERTGVRFSFFTPFPIDLNRFVIERADPDASHGRLYFMRGDCRFELTISQSVLRDGEWTPVLLAPILTPPSSGPSPCLKVRQPIGRRRIREGLPDRHTERTVRYTVEPENRLLFEPTAKFSVARLRNWPDRSERPAQAIGPIGSCGPAGATKDRRWPLEQQRNSCPYRAVGRKAFRSAAEGSAFGFASRQMSLWSPDRKLKNGSN
jgi:hypothetical protein